MVLACNSVDEGSYSWAYMVRLLVRFSAPVGLKDFEGA